MLELMDFDRNPNIGIFCKANENIVFVRKGLQKRIRKKIEKALDVKLVEISIANANIIGSILAINSKGAIVTDFVDEESSEILEKQGLNVFAIQDNLNATGNNVLVNDYGALVHPDIKKSNIKKMEDVLDVPVYQGTIAGLKTVGMAAVVTNKGLLCHPKVEEKEREQLESIFDVEVMIGTVNHGVPLIGSGLVANSKGAIIGSLTTGIELNRIEEALGFI
ncbi:MAG: translation initiation factor IF-6 [Thermoplasmata archaeon]|nr:translation initiation factor IF-6 [Thermoplasmata archaeon]